jgi:F0F1-type ATP synthase assembly protein I
LRSNQKRGVGLIPNGYLPSMAIKKKVARKAVKATAMHTAHGTVSKLKREPVRATALLGAGVLVGLLVGWVVSRGGGADHAPEAASR